MPDSEGRVQILSQERQDAIIQALNRLGASQPCPRCLNPKFTLVDGYFNPVLQHDVKQILLGGVSIPVAVVACTRCGWIAMHALGALGLMSGAEDRK